MIVAIVCAASRPQALVFARDTLGLDDERRFLRNALVITSDTIDGPDDRVRGIHSSVPFYVLGGGETERLCEKTIRYLTDARHPREAVDDAL